MRAVAKPTRGYALSASLNYPCFSIPDFNDLILRKKFIEYKSDNIVVRHSFFENKMCHVRDNPRWALSHVDDMLDILENHADECAKDNLTSS